MPGTTTHPSAMSSKMDMAEEKIEQLERKSREKTGMGVFHWVALGSVGASVALFAAGRKKLAMAVGLWPPAAQAIWAARRGCRAAHQAD